MQRQDVRAAIGRSAREPIERYQEEAQRGLFVDQLGLIWEREVSWGIGQARREARRDRLERSMAEAESLSARGYHQMRRLRSLAKTAGLP
jgi:hypothetical protein